MSATFIFDSKRTIRAWCMYDWANSVYSLTITTAIFPSYYEKSTSIGGSDLVTFFGFAIRNTVLYSYALSFSFLFVAILLPLLTGIADSYGRKKLFMKIFAYTGALSCLGLYFFTGENVEWGIICSILASIGYAGSLVFYNSFLPEITRFEKFDRVSAQGFSYGYIGSVILLIFNLLMVQYPEIFGLSSSGIAARVSFLTVGVWWIAFSQIPFYYLPDNLYDRKLSTNVLTRGYREIRKVWQQLKDLPMLKRYLTAFFLYNTGVQTVMYVAVLFGSKELQLETSNLILIVLIIQLVAIGGSYLFAWLSSQKGNVFSLKVMIVIWIGVCAAAFYTYYPWQFYVIAVVVGMVMGGIQSLSRATYSKLIPAGTIDHASFFSFYDVTFNISIVVGTFAYGAIEQVTGSMRNSSLALALFFIAGMLLLWKVVVPRSSAH